MDLNRMRIASHLLPDPGGEVVRELADEIEQQQEGNAAMKEGVAIRIADLEAEIKRLREVNWVWDDRDLESANASIEDAVGCDDPGDIIPLRPIHELPPVYVLVLEGGHEVYGSQAEADAARERKKGTSP